MNSLCSLLTLFLLEILWQLSKFKDKYVYKILENFTHLLLFFYYYDKMNMKNKT